jgi:hypothetical protein
MSNKLEKLNALLLEVMMDDLDDPQKCTPGLYQVVRGYINDNREQIEDIPREAIDFLEKRMTDAIPFRKGA